MSVLHIVTRIILGFFVIAAPLSSNIGKTIALVVVVLVAIIWGGFDGIKDARANPDPDDYEDLTIRWLKVGLFAAVISCFVCWVLGTLWLNGIGQAAFWIDMTAGVSFVTLIVYVPAFFGVSMGRFFVRRDQRKAELAAEEAAEAKTTEFAPTA